jgi:SET domain
LIQPASNAEQGPALELRMTQSKGLGVVTRDRIEAGRRVLAMGGTVLPTAALTDDMLALQIDDDSWLTSDGSLIDDRINHSCEPNLAFLRGDPVLYALRDIAPDEELCFDYSTSISFAGWRLDCRCGSPRCRGLILPWDELNSTERARLRGRALRYLRGPRPAASIFASSAG